LELEIIALDKAQELPDLIRLCLAFDILQVDQFWYGWVDVDMMAAINAGELEPKRFGTRHRIGKPNIF
jgi:hypothetical protein